MESNRVSNQTRDLQNQTTTKRWSDLLITSMRQTELDDTKSFYELIKTMKKLQKQTNRRLYIFIKNKTTAYVIANICHKRVTTTTFYNLKCIRKSVCFEMLQHVYTFDVLTALYSQQCRDLRVGLPATIDAITLHPSFWPKFEQSNALASKRLHDR